MITSSKEADFTAKEEGSGGKKNKAAPSSSSTPWTRLKDPRIVRVSRAFGGKDRHSKVCTVRGLRDRRVRLSVPTAIQLYDLQDRLGLNQPSKVVDWLLEAAKDEIDELPPLQIPPGNFLQSYQLLPSNHGVTDGSSQFLNKEGLNKISNSVNWDNPLRNSGHTMRPDKSKVVGKEVTDDLNEDWSRRNGIDQEEKEEANVSTNDFFPRSNHSSIPGFLNNVVQPYNSFYRWDPSNFSLSNGFAPQTEEVQNFNVVPLPPTLSLPTGSQVLVCPPGTAQSYFPSHAPPFVELDQKQINHFQMLSSISSQNPLSNSLVPTLYSTGGAQSMKPLHLSIAPKLLHSENNSTSGSQPNTNGDFSLK